MEFINLIDSIADLLYKHNCVIIPDFGGFITNFKASGFEESRNTISPSCKKVVFNQSLIENDGLLVNNWAQCKKVSYKEALEDISSFSNYLKHRIFSNKSFEFKNIGTFYLNSEDKIIFVPYQALNFLESSFGLYPVKIKPINVQQLVSINQKQYEPFVAKYENENAEAASENISTGRTIHFNYPALLKVASIILIAGVSLFSVYYLINTGKRTDTALRKSNEQNASILTINTKSKKPLKLAKLDFDAERQKINSLKTDLKTFSQNNLTKDESYNVVVGYYANKAAANKTLHELSFYYSNAKLTEKTAEGYGVIVEKFYKHTTAATFTVMLKQNGFRNVKIEKQVVIGK